MIRALKKAGIEEKYFDTGELKLNYVVGPRNGLPLVFFPAQGMTWEEYQLILPKLSNHFQVFAVSVHGHGRSIWIPGKYTFNRIGRDFSAFLSEAVGRPAVVGCNSSGGVIAVWLAAYAPQWVLAVIAEDPPLFRCDWPNIKTLYVNNLFITITKTMAKTGSVDIPKLLTSLTVPPEVSAVVQTPSRNLFRVLSKIIAFYQAIRPGKSVDLPFLPLDARLMIKGWSEFDPTFSQAFCEGTMGEGFDHAAALAKVTQPMLFLHARWFMSKEHRIVGALTDDDVGRVRSLVKGKFEYLRMDCGHAIPICQPDLEASEIIKFVDKFVKRESAKTA